MLEDFYGLRFQELKLRNEPIHETGASKNQCTGAYTVLGAVLATFVMVNRTNNEKYQFVVVAEWGSLIHTNGMKILMIRIRFIRSWLYFLNSVSPFVL